MEQPRKCRRIKRVRGDHRDDYLLVKIDPPLIGQQYGLGGQDMDKVIIATRHRGASLFPITEWPVFVHVARVLVDNPEDRDIVHNNEIEAIAWAAIYKTDRDAYDKIVPPGLTARTMPLK